MSEVQSLTRNNTAQAYNLLWNDEELLKFYLEPKRVDGYKLIANYVLSKGYGNKIIELGFGSADFLKILLDYGRDRNFEVYGVDYARSGVKRARRLVPSGKFIQGDICNLNFGDSYFDQVFCIQTLEHLNNPLKALHEMDRICKPDGMILVSVPNGDIDNFQGHINFWSPDEFKSFLNPRKIMDFIMYNDNRAMMAAFSPLKVER